MQVDEETLEVLRDALAQVKRSQGRGVARDVLPRLSAALPAGLGLTVDFDAESTLGHPMVVLRPTSAPDPSLAALTPREHEVAALVATGMRNKDIAIALDLSVATVKDHVHHILTKTGLDSRTGIAALLR